jgi:transposase
MKPTRARPAECAAGSTPPSLGGQKRFRCPACGIDCDRDVHAARNILLRYLSDVPFREEGSVALRPTSFSNVSSAVGEMSDA